MIEIRITAPAEARLRELQLEGAAIRLRYDSEGCGCAVSGVAALHIASGPDADDVPAKSDTSIPIYYEQRHEVFFEPRLKLDYSPERNAFSLVGDGQLYGSRILLQDLRR